MIALSSSEIEWRTGPFWADEFNWWILTGCFLGASTWNWIWNQKSQSKKLMARFNRFQENELMGRVQSDFVRFRWKWLKLTFLICCEEMMKIVITWFTGVVRKWRDDVAGSRQRSELDTEQHRRRQRIPRLRRPAAPQRPINATRRPCRRSAHSRLQQRQRRKPWIAPWRRHSRSGRDSASSATSTDATAVAKEWRHRRGGSGQRPQRHHRQLPPRFLFHPLLPFQILSGSFGILENYHLILIYYCITTCLLIELQCGGLKDPRQEHPLAPVAPTGGSSKSTIRRRRTPSTAATETWPNATTRRSATSSPKRMKCRRKATELSVPVDIISGRPTTPGWLPTWADPRLRRQTSGTTSTTRCASNRKRSKSVRRISKRKWMPHRRRCRRRRAGRT